MKTMLIVIAVAMALAGPAVAQQNDWLHSNTITVPNGLGGTTTYDMGTSTSQTSVIPDGNGGFHTYTFGPSGSTSSSDVIPNGAGGYSVYTFGGGN